MTTFEVKFKGNLCLVNGQGHYFGQQSIMSVVHYISTIDFKVHFMQVYQIIQDYNIM